jgi:hypothetical protein
LSSACQASPFTAWVWLTLSVKSSGGLRVLVEFSYDLGKTAEELRAPTPVQIPKPRLPSCVALGGLLHQPESPLICGMGMVIVSTSKVLKMSCTCHMVYNVTIIGPSSSPSSLLSNKREDGRGD